MASILDKPQAATMTEFFKSTPFSPVAITLCLILVGRRTASGRQGRGRNVRTPEGEMPRNFATATSKEFEFDTPGS
jgi:hypothetical protein